ncbi:hypothetical protein EMCRGX_G020887, partial [Ephydatia muelleri]
YTEMTEKVANKREPVPDYKQRGRNPVLLGTFKLSRHSSSPRAVNLISAATLSTTTCFQDTLFVNEDKSYEMLVESCSTTQPYSLLDILDENGISIDDDWNKESCDIIAAIGIAKYFEKISGNVLSIIHEPTKKLIQSSATTSSSRQSHTKLKFKGAVLNSGLAVVCGRQVFPSNNLTTWLANS